MTVENGAPTDEKYERIAKIKAEEINLAEKLRNNEELCADIQLTPTIWQRLSKSGPVSGRVNHRERI